MSKYVYCSKNYSYVIPVCVSGKKKKNDLIEYTLIID